jgi:hypothetical protein
MSNTSPSSTTSLQLSGTVYDNLKRIVQVILPGIGTLYFTLAQIWGLPAGEQVVGTCTALALFLGLALAISSKSFNNTENSAAVGTFKLVPTEDGRSTMVVNVVSDPEEFKGKDEISFKLEGSE